MRSSANKQRKLHARWLTARSSRDGSLRGPAAMVAARSCRDGRCAVLPRWSLRGPAAMVAARSCRDGRCAVLPRWLAARSCRDGSLRGPAAMVAARSCRDVFSKHGSGPAAATPCSALRGLAGSDRTSQKMMRARVVRCQAFLSFSDVVRNMSGVAHACFFARRQTRRLSEVDAFGTLLRKRCFLLNDRRLFSSNGAKKLSPS